MHSLFGVDLFFWYKLNLFFSAYIKGDGELGDNFTFEEPLVDGSNSSFDLSGIIIFKVFFLSGIGSSLSSRSSSFISFIPEGFFLIVFEGFKSLGWSFFNLFFVSFELSFLFGKSKKSSGNIFVLIFLKFVIL